MERPLIPIHIGYGSSERYAEMEAWQRIAALTSTRPVSGWRPIYSQPNFPWSELGIDPRWPNQDTSVCVGAIEIGIENDGGGQELERLYLGAKDRGEDVLIVSSFSATRLQVPGPSPSRVTLPCRVNDAEIAARRLPEGVAPRLADELDDVERDLALRLLEHDGPWWAVEIHYDPDHRYRGSRTVPLPGTIRPILQTPAGEIVAAEMVPYNQPSRWFLVPDLLGDNVLRWLVDRAIPEYVPGALLRTRSAHLVDATLLTRAEADANAALRDFEEVVEQRRTQLASDLAAAADAAGVIRDRLLFGSGRQLVEVVTGLLRRAGFEVEDLDERYGSETADLLATADGENWLIEVKGVTGAPKEAFVEDLRRHERTFAALDGRPVAGSVLLVNHHTKTPPRARPLVPYSRRAFVDALPVVVIGSVTLFDWWKDNQLDRLYGAVTAQPRQH